jgi:hypothetical protein
MSLQAWHLVLLIYPILIALAVLGLYWVIRLAVRAGIRDSDRLRAREGADAP